jgi:hypothetical protein
VISDHDDDRPYLTADICGCIDHVVGDVSQALSGLESLTIDTTNIALEHISFDAHNAFFNFETLTRLRLPQALLLGTVAQDPSGDLFVFDQMIPPSVVKLEIQSASAIIFDLIESIIRDRISVPDLGEVLLYWGDYNRLLHQAVTDIEKNASRRSGRKRQWRSSSRCWASVCNFCPRMYFRREGLMRWG